MNSLEFKDVFITPLLSGILKRFQGNLNWKRYTGPVLLLLVLLLLLPLLLSPSSSSCSCSSSPASPPPPARPAPRPSSRPLYHDHGLVMVSAIFVVQQYEELDLFLIEIIPYINIKSHPQSFAIHLLRKIWCSLKWTATAILKLTAILSFFRQGGRPLHTVLTDST